MTVDIGTVLPSHGVFNKKYWPVLAFFSKNWPEISNRCLEILFLCLRDGLALRSIDFIILFIIFFVKNAHLF